MKKYLLSILFIAFWSCEEAADPDTTPPTVSITTAFSGSVSEIVTISVMVNDESGIDKVELWVDGVNTGVTDDTEPYTLLWNTSSYEDSSAHVIVVRVYDTSGNTADSQPITLTVDNTASAPQGGNITLVTYTLTEMVVVWEQSEDEDLQNYKVLYSETESGDKDTIATYTDKTTTSHTMTEFDPTHENWFWVQLTDTLGFSRVGTGMTNEIDSPPNQSEFYGVVYENDSFIITWSQNIDADFQSYSLDESFSEDMSGATLIYETDLLADTTYTVTGISDGEIRYYQVVTKDVFGLETESAIGVALYTRLWSDIYDWQGLSDWGNSVIEVSDGYWTLGVGDYRMRLFKTDLAGNLATSTEFGFGYGNQILEADDGSLFLIGGGYDSDIGEYAMLVIKTDAAGTELWRQYLGANSWGYGGLLNDNGEIIIYGEEDGNAVVYALSQDGTNFDVVVAFDHNMDRAKGMVKVDGGGYYIAFSKDYETIILGTDENFVWETEVNIAGYCRSLSLAGDGTLLTTLQTSENEHTYMKFYPQTGQTIWSGTAAGLYSGFQAGDSYYFVGHSDDGMSLFLRLNENGDIITSSSFGSGILSGYAVTSDGGLIFTGTTSYWNDEHSDTPLYKTNLDGELGNTFNLAHGPGHVFSIGINKDFNMAPVQMDQKQSD